MTIGLVLAGLAAAGASILASRDTVSRAWYDSGGTIHVGNWIQMKQGRFSSARGASAFARRLNENHGWEAQIIQVPSRSRPGEWSYQVIARSVLPGRDLSWE